jgi:hypothetical protein
MIKILGFLGILALSALFIWGMEQGFDRQEVVECNQWKAQAAEFENFYLTGWQADQCEAHGITIDTTIVR